MMFLIPILSIFAGAKLAFALPYATPVFLGEIPSSADDLKMLGGATAVLLILGLVVGVVWQLWGKPDRSKTTEVDGKKNITLRTEVEFVPVEKFEVLDQYAHHSHHKVLNELNIIGLRMEERRIEAIEMNAAVRETLDQKFTQSIEGSKTDAKGIHQRIDLLAQQVNILTGETKHLVQAVSEATRAAQEAAVAAATAAATASAGGRSSIRRDPR